MTNRSLRVLAAFGALLSLASAAAVDAKTLRVEAFGIDSGTCGLSLVAPCRSIGQAVMNYYDNNPGPSCGLLVSAASAVSSSDFWGSSAGPGADPADTFCTGAGGVVNVTAHYTSPIKVVRQSPKV